MFTTALARYDVYVGKHKLKFIHMTNMLIVPSKTIKPNTFTYTTKKWSMVWKRTKFGSMSKKNKCEKKNDISIEWNQKSLRQTTVATMLLRFERKIRENSVHIKNTPANTWHPLRIPTTADVRIERRERTERTETNGNWINANDELISSMHPYTQWLCDDYTRKTCVRREKWID